MSTQDLVTGTEVLSPEYNRLKSICCGTMSAWTAPKNVIMGMKQFGDWLLGLSKG